jgi:IS30 family transposase
VHRKLRQGWSPEIIAGRITRAHPRLSISHEAIYQYVYQPAVRRQENLVACLVRAHRRRQIKGHRHTHREPHIPGRISILQRPAHVDNRKQFGHWESDAMQSRQSLSTLHVMVERKTRFMKISKLERRSARHTRTAITRTLSRYPSHARRSITYDNGKENVEHLEVNRVLGTKSFFCEPFHSWEKATVENTIGLVRRTYPKKTNFDLVSAQHAKRLERKLNNRPRKVLQFRTPKEVFNRTVALAR